MAQSWHDINDPGTFWRKPEESAQGVSEPETTIQKEEKEDPEVKFVSSKWKPGSKGFEYLEQCFLEVKAEYLKKTSRAKINGKLFGTFQGTEQDLKHEVTGYLDRESGVAKMEIAKLWFIDAHYDKWVDDKTAPCSYQIKGIAHSLGANTLDSEALDMPYKEKQTVNFIEMPDCHFNHDSGVPSIDKNGDFFAAITAALAYAKNNPDKELLIAGHTDTSGTSEYNQELSELRAKCIKAFMDNDKDAFVNVAGKKSTVADYQGILSALSAAYGWSCDPGAADNSAGPKTQAALKDFQAEYNEIYEQKLEADGAIGPKTWEAFFNVVRDILWAIVAKQTQQEQVPQPKYDGSGVIGYGETRPIEKKDKDNYKSKTNRRVELIFKDQGQKIDEPKEITMEPIEVKAPPAATISGLELKCKHRSKGTKKRYLGIVPDPSDQVSLIAHTKNGTPEITWKISGIKKEDLSGTQATLDLKGFSAQAKNLIPAFINDSFLRIIPPKKIFVKAVDESQKAIGATIELYPYNKTIQEIKVPTGLKRATEFAEKINHILKTKFDTGLEFETFVGKVHIEAQWSEDEEGPEVFPKFEIKGGFYPLVGIKWTGKIQLVPVMNAIPEKLRKYIAEIAAFLTVNGEVNVAVGFERVNFERVAGKGSLEGSIGVAVGLMAQIGNGKIIALKAQLSSSVGGEFYIHCKKRTDESKNWGFFATFEAKFGAVKGGLSFELFDGMYSRNEEIILIEENKWTPLKDKPLFGSETETNEEITSENGGGEE